MEITCGITAFYKDREKWNQIEVLDSEVYISQGFEIDYELYICAIGEQRFEDRVLKTKRFKKTGTTRHYISFMSVTFRYDERYDEIVCTNQIITI